MLLAFLEYIPLGGGGGNCSLAQLCPTLCNPTPGSPVLHHLPELAQTHVH